LFKKSPDEQLRKKSWEILRDNEIEKSLTSIMPHLTNTYLGF